MVLNSEINFLKQDDGFQVNIGSWRLREERRHDATEVKCVGGSGTGCARNRSMGKGRVELVDVAVTDTCSFGRMWQTL